MPRKRKHSRRTEAVEAEPPKFTPGFLSRLDGRTEIAKVLKTRYNELVSDLGDIGVVKGSMAERYVCLEGIIRNIELGLSTVTDSKTADALLGKYVQGLNTLMGLAKTLGLERRMGSDPWAQLDVAAAIRSSESKRGKGITSPQEPAEHNDE